MRLVRVRYDVIVTWTGSRGEGTSGYRAYRGIERGTAAATLLSDGDERSLTGS